MGFIEKIKELNSNINLHHVNEPAFVEYGKVIQSDRFEEIIKFMSNIDIPKEGNIYIGSDAVMEKKVICEELQTEFYGGMPVQIGYCNGVNSHMNGLEYHKGNEINVACTDFILLLGKVQDIVDNEYLVEHLKAFFVPKGTAIELYSTTLHYAPCKVTSEGFKCIVILPKGTNEELEDLDRGDGESELLFMTNKWLLAHPDREQLIQKGAYPGLIGKNIEIYYE